MEIEKQINLYQRIKLQDGFLPLFIILSYIFIPNNYSIGIIYCLLTYFILFILIKDKSASFIYLFYLVIDPIDLFDFNGLKILLFIISLLIPISIHKNFFKIIFSDKKFMIIIRLYFLFFIYQISSLIFSQNISIEFFKEFFLSFFGFLIIIPAYYYATTSGLRIFKYLIILSFASSLFYFLNLIGILEFIEFRRFQRFHSDSSFSIERIFYSDLRQSIKIFIYAIPLIFVKHFNRSLRLLILFTGLMTLYIILAAYLRNEILYTVLGTITFFIFLVFKLNKTINLLYTSLISLVLVLVFVYYNNEIIVNLYNIVTSSVDNYFSVSRSDASIFNRLITQWPIVLDIFNQNPIFGSGYFSTSYTKTGHHLLLDLPLTTSFATFGIIGVLLHLSKYVYLIYSFFKIDFKKIKSNNFCHSSILILIGSYFVTQITFRNFQINLELGFDWWYIEHAFFIAIFYAFLKNYINYNYEKNNN